MGVSPLVSIIVPACNTQDFVAHTLRSIQQQKFENWECLVVDDASQDSTRNVIQATIAGDRRFRLVRQPFRKGVSAARNRGFAESSPEAPWVSFMDSDDCWLPETLHWLVQCLELSPEAVGAHGLGQFIAADGSPMHPGAFEAFGRQRLGYRDGTIRVWPLHEPSCFATQCWTGTIYPPGLFLARRQAYLRAGLFDESMHLSEDWDMIIRLSRLGNIPFLDRVLLQYRRHHANATRDHTSNSRAVRIVHHKTFFSSENQECHRHILREGWTAWERFKLREKCRLALHSLKQRDLCALTKNLVATPLHALRYLSGYPEFCLL
ncbi:MAG: hypothetical protein RLZZ244_587 [Verrucomicrobiota bacterium]|jgi:glycosyltransferase involved in cell wall biosynthesis